MTYIGPVYDETKLTPCIHCGMSERNCFSAKKAGCVSCCPKCDHSKICPTCKRLDWQDCLPPIAEKPKSALPGKWKPGMPVGEVKAFDGAGNEYMALIDFKELYPEVQSLLNESADKEERYKKMWEDLKRSAEMHILRCQLIDGQDLKNRMEELESSQEGSQ